MNQTPKPTYPVHLTSEEMQHLHRLLASENVSHARLPRWSAHDTNARLRTKLEDGGLLP